MNFEVMNGVVNFIEFFEENWTYIVFVILFVNAVIMRVRNYMQLSTDEKLDVAKKQIKETMLKFITEAEVDYFEWASAGSIKRSQVIDELYAAYPILSKVADQDVLTEWLDDTIDEALETMRKIFEENAENTNKEDV